jgi:hypothetical protein
MLYYGLNDGVRYAVELAARGNVGDEFVVYGDRSGTGKVIYVRPASDDKPEEFAIIHAIACKWNSDTVQIRTDGATSEFVLI